VGDAAGLGVDVVGDSLVLDLEAALVRQLQGEDTVEDTVAVGAGMRHISRLGAVRLLNGPGHAR